MTVRRRTDPESDSVAERRAEAESEEEGGVVWREVGLTSVLHTGEFDS